MIAGPPPPAVVQPAAYEVSYGLVTGWVAKGTRRVVIRVDGRRLADRRIAGRHFTMRVDLPPRELSLSVTAVGANGRRSSSRVEHVVGLPQVATPQARAPHLDAVLARRIHDLVGAYGGSCAVYVENLTDGSGAAWNARARFPAASTLKLAIAVTALADRDDFGTPGPGTVTDSLLRRMIENSDNDAADDLEIRVAGSTSAGGRRVNELMGELGLTDTLMYGGYERGFTARLQPIPLRVDDQQSFARGKYTSAHDLAGLLRAIWLASRGQGRLHANEPSFTAADARHLLYLLSRVRDKGKLDREVGRVPGAQVLHKAGWISTVRHDNGLVFWRGGVFLATVMTYRAGGAGISSDILAGRVAAVAFARFRR
ncbi:MAG: serine hydrolase [Gaiellaceae bacterium]